MWRLVFLVVLALPAEAASRPFLRLREAACERGREVACERLADEGIGGPSPEDGFLVRFPGVPEVSRIDIGTPEAPMPVWSWILDRDGARYVATVAIPPVVEEVEPWLASGAFFGEEATVEAAVVEHGDLVGREAVGVLRSGRQVRVRTFWVDGRRYTITVIAPPDADLAAYDGFFDSFALAAL